MLVDIKKRSIMRIDRLINTPDLHQRLHDNLALNERMRQNYPPEFPRIPSDVQGWILHFIDFFIAFQESMIQDMGSDYVPDLQQYFKIGRYTKMNIPQDRINKIEKIMAPYNPDGVSYSVIVSFVNSAIDQTLAFTESIIFGVEQLF